MASSIEKMEESNSETAAGAAGGGVDKGKQQELSWEYPLRKYLMLLATVVATATYAAGFSPPGGVSQAENTAGVPVLYDAPRYLAFFYLNATAFAASLVVNLLLLVLSERRTAWLAALRFVMVLDLLGLMGAYAAGSCRDVPTTVYASVLVVALATYVGIHILLASYASSSTEKEEERPDDEAASLKLKEQRKVLMLLATFAVGISYAAGLSPPGGFRDDASDTDADAGKPMLQARHSARLMAFFYCNTTAFVASLLVIVLLLGRRLRRYYAQVQLYSFILVGLFGLLGAYAAGSSRKADTTAYVVALVGAVPAYIFLVMVLMLLASDPLKNSRSWLRLKSISARASNWLQERGCHGQHGPSPARELSPATSSDGGDTDEMSTSNKTEGMEKVKSLVLLLATLAATVTYQAGLDPPGGVWPEDGATAGAHHKAGDPILLTTHARRYKVFLYCNSTAFVASLVVILMVQNRGLIRRHTLEAAMVLDLFGLIGAYAAGSCREVSTSIYVMALAGAVLVYVVIHVVFFTLDYDEADMPDGEKRKLDKRRKRLLLLAILVATVTYQAGLTPPGGFWTENGHGHGAGSPILQDHEAYRRRYVAFFYCNSTSFMASVALIIMLVNPNLYRPGIRCYALYVCMVAALFGLMAAYAAGSARRLRASIYVFVLVGAVVAFIIVQLCMLVFFRFCAAAGNGEDSSSSGTSTGNGTANDSSSSSSGGSGSPKLNAGEESSRRRKYLMMLAILAASVTYQAGLKPPGSTWQDGDGEGNPVMRDRNRPRYQAFFYCNSTSFVASVVVIVLLLQESSSLQQGDLLLYAMNTAIVLDLLGLLGAYAAGSSREWETSGHVVVALVAAVLAYVAVHLAVWFFGGWRAREKVSSSSPAQLPAAAQSEEQRDVRRVEVSLEQLLRC